MSEIRDVKTKPVNDALVELLQDKLEEAKSGQLRSMLFVTEFDDGNTNHGWSTPHYSRFESLLGQLVLLQSDYANNVNVRDACTVIGDLEREVKGQ